MPRRAAASATPATPTPLTDSTHTQQLDDPFAPQVSLLRRQWKWAAFSQFFHTFASLFAMPDVSLSDIEDDLTRSTSIVIHRVMHRLLVTATQDRKMSLENWQTSLRKQYKKRDPDLNPIGPEPVVEHPTPAPDSPDDDDDGEHKTVSVSIPGSSEFPHGDAPQADAVKDDDHLIERDIPRDSSNDVNLDEMKVESTCTSPAPQPEPQEESKDWLTLPMLTKLDSLHLLTEWQFHNVNRFRTIMKDDDETAQWRIEPIGYDSKTNAYWLIGPDRLWIQRTIPKPPRNLKRKRTLTRPKPKPDAAFTDDESDAPPTPKKRKATSTIRIPPASSSTPTRPTRPRRPPSSPSELGPIASRGPRAAKMQASAKLSAQAKELAELQRQAAMEGRRSSRRIASPSPSQSSPRRPLGTRMSARLRGATQVEDGWQEVPDEWLKDGAEEDDGASASEHDEDVEMGVNSEAKPDLDPEPETEPDEDMDAQLGKTGLESDDDAVSELTELSEITPPATVVATRPTSRQNSKKSGSSRKKPSQSRGRTLTIEASLPEDEIEPEWRPPDDFIEWETICVTLCEWEHICERFQGATHYAERALYKVLSQEIVPAITAELREIQRKRHLEEAVSHRKRSSRLAVKENEKEEARQAAMKRAEEEEKLSRARRLEARQKREEEERLKREVAREKRRLDREERERRAQTGAEQQSNPGSLVDVVGDDSLPGNAPAKPPKGRPGRPKTKALTQVSSSASASGSRTPVGEDWVLDCDICHRTGVNKDDGSPLLCCGKCSKWQHIACHDLADRQAGRPKRDWDREEFICRACQDRGVVNGRPGLNGSGSYDARTPNPYHHSAYTSPIPYSSAYPPHTPRSPYQRHTAITFTHYQPQQHGFSSAHALHAQSMIPAAAATAATYSQPHYSPSKSTQYTAALQQYPPHSYSNGANWPSPTPPAQSSASRTPHLQTSYPASSYSPSVERSSMSSAYPPAAQNGNTTVQPQPWRGGSYVAPVGGVSSYYSQNAQPQPHQHRAP